MKPTVIFMLFLWRLVEFTLTLNECSKLPSVQHAFVLDEYKKAEYQKGDVIYFCCDPGFTTGLNTTYICTEDGWTAEAIGQCVENSFPVLLGCTPPPPLTNGYLLDNTTLIYGNGQIVRFGCDDHHTMTGALFKTCTNGQWTGDIQCIPITCKVSADPPSGTTYNPRDRIIFTPGESLTVTCGENKWVKSTELQTAQLVCKNTGRTGSWDFNPVCQRMQQHTLHTQICI
ncbi:complement factor H-related protein 4-like [Boleophthalmus pectinirostris]|uniref:complement factor H-related protein 4-like n=1 Tax=Boleophthalmus pectinirostris TaxID=150288 RepID=UPI00242E3918|nr:complement factor H-related protein 4-like [Boleophthalmus pectinirostris]